MLSTLKLLESKGRFLEPCATSLTPLAFACDWQSNKAKFRSPSCSSSNDSSSNGSCWNEQENLLFHQSRSPRKNFNMISMVFQLFMRFGHMLFEEDAHLESECPLPWECVSTWFLFILFLATPFIFLNFGLVSRQKRVSEEAHVNCHNDTCEFPRL